jgi:UDP-3-O-[3-hydroxymyristoyl] glucosamine N-acyltransferase
LNNWTLGQLAELVKGTLQGDSQLPVTGVAAIEAAGPGDLTFIADKRHLARLEDRRISAIVVPPDAASDARLTEIPAIVVADPQTAFMRIAGTLRPPRARPARGISPQASVSASATIGEECWIGAGAVIGDDVVMGRGCDIHPGAVIGDGCRIGDEVVIYPHAVLYHDTLVDDRSIIHAGAILGADGFGYRFVQGRFEKIPQLGWVHIHADCEIGAGTTIDRGMIGPTIIGQGTKLDNMVMIAHNCQLGKHNIFASQVGLAGSCITGDYVRLGGQVGVKDHVTLNSGCSIGAKAGVHKDIPTGETWIGYPATPEAEQKRLVFSLKRVPEMRDQVRQLEAKVRELTAQLQQLLGEQDVPQARAA